MENHHAKQDQQTAMNVTTQTERVFFVMLVTNQKMVNVLHAPAIHMEQMEFHVNRLIIVLMDMKGIHNHHAQNVSQDMKFRMESAKSVEMETSVLMELNAKYQQVFQTAHHITKHKTDANNVTKD